MVVGYDVFLCVGLCLCFGVMWVLGKVGVLIWNVFVGVYCYMVI